MSFLNKEKKLTSIEKLKAAYMLNLCTVSVSQIIEYNDLNIMEQEYNAILNNLNLQEMPKDEAFLHILKELLNTITFFRIQDVDKKFIEHEYQQKMKNAIWSSVPNLSVIVATGNPVVMAISLAAQAGISYMNYRKAKAQNLLDKEKQEWQLQRSAIEQFNVIRRELFDTAWRIADKYDFPDNYRLTENQIKQYNEILMDTNLLRKYERLESIEDDFIAYPPFWYHYGNTANAISIEYKSNTAICETYRKKAISHFEHFDKVNLPLLREDQIAASCELEYVDLLDPIKDKEKILSCINKARKLAGREFDVLQLCAFAYQRIGVIDESESLFRMLVNEDYNKNINAQILSRIYVAKVMANRSEEEKRLYSAQYELLKERQINSRYLFPMDETLDDKALMDRFFQSQTEILNKKVEMVIESVFNKYGILFNKVIPKPNDEKQYEESFYSPEQEIEKKRIETYKSELSNIRILDRFKNKYDSLDIPLMWLDVLNSLLDSLSVLSDELSFDECTRRIESMIITNRENIEKINGPYTPEKLGLIKELSFSLFTDLAKKEILEELKKQVESAGKLLGDDEDSRMSRLSILEGELRNLCHKENIQEPEVLFDKESVSLTYEDKRKLPVSLLGNKAVERKVEADNENKIIEKVKNASAEITNGHFDKICFYYKKENDASLSKYFHGNNLKSITIAAMDFKNKFPEKNDDLIFTKKGIILVHNNKAITGNQIPYREIKLVKDGKALEIGTKYFYNKYINLNKLCDLCHELSSYNQEG